MITKVFRIFLFPLLFSLLQYAPVRAACLYDDFNDNKIDTLKWHWRNGIPEAGVIESDGTLSLEASSTNQNPQIFFTYSPNTIEADVTLWKISENSTSEGGTQISVVWFYDEALGQRVVSKIGINYKKSTGNATFSAKVQSKNDSSDNTDIYSSKYRDCLLNTPYRLKMEKRNQSIHYYIDGVEWTEAACTLPTTVASIDQIIIDDRSDEVSCHIPDIFYQKYFLIDNFFEVGQIKSSYDNIWTDRYVPPKGNYQVRDPLASFFDTVARKKFLESAKDPTINSIKQDFDYIAGTYIECSSIEFPDPVGTPSSIFEMPDGYYQDDPDAFDQARELLEEYEKAIQDLSVFSMYRTVSMCAEHLLDILDYWASNRALLNYHYSSNHSAWYWINWSASASAFSYSLIKNDLTLDSFKKKNVENWLKDVTRKMLSYSGSSSDSINNHLYWRGVAAAMTGVVADDDELFDYGVRVFLRALEAMNPDGSFPLEMMRGQCAIHYQNFSIWPLVFIAEIASRQGYDLYSASVDGKNIHLAIDFLFDALGDPQILVQKGYTATTVQDFLAKDKWSKGWYLSWIEPYQRRFKVEQITDYLEAEGLKRDENIFKNPWTGGPSTLWYYKSLTTSPEACDLNGDNRVGLEEVIYLLQIISGYR